jgi:hypothetical protein
MLAPVSKIAVSSTGYCRRNSSTTAVTSSGYSAQLGRFGRQLAAMAPDAEFVDIVLETDGKALGELATELLAELGWID